MSSLKPFIEKIISIGPGTDQSGLSYDEIKAAFDVILSGNADPIQVGALLMCLRMKGETPTEIAGMVDAMNDACSSVNLPGRKLLDIVGTGGDGADTINISTASVVLAAACGATVAKAGNRSVSSACGSADVLGSLGVVIDLSPKEVERCVEDCGVAFMFAPVNHPSMKAVGPVRRALGIRSCFNILGPMTNAAGAQHAVIGVFDESLQPLMADALIKVGRVDHAVIIHGCGLDEISPVGPATILEIRNVAPEGETRSYEKKNYSFDPLEVGIPRCDILDLRGGGPEQNAQEFRDVLEGGEHTNAKRDSIVLNAGVGCYVYGLAESIEEGVKLARMTLVSGKASDVLKKWIHSSQVIRNEKK